MSNITKSAILIKAFLLSLFLIIVSCKNILKNPYAIPFNTEIFCPFRPSILVKFVTSKELKDAAIRDYLRDRQGDKKRNITIFYLKDRRSFSVKIPPEQIIECEFRQSPYGTVDSFYVHSF